ncbi:MAG: glycosyltransferase family 2 protein [Pseudomonadota bacterium]|nr:glycosyltransferase family 2 protein [Pseudomonadota bacterium]
MRTIISHFYNEEYLLPWWLQHHVAIFDYGVMIDYASTDASVDICRSIAPNWRVVRSRNLKFEAIAVDFEVMQYESELPGWKIVLNTTEFLCGVNLPAMEQAMVIQDIAGCYLESAIMVDVLPEQPPTQALPLVEQKYHGFMEDYPKVHSRIYHRASIGAYLPGRHASSQPGLTQTSGIGTVMWYGMSPWTEAARKRHLQIQTQIPERDRRAGFGAQHMVDIAQLEQKRQSVLSQAVDLRHLVVR